ncbi:Gfo/Idh/MocA family protein [Aestuariibius insulae]|uniref:Gfo/Idh/MocA family protein n=1 Tax=Aestuariibius insulae TaxID=2058287 RepID=UPI00345EC4BF
MTARIRWGVIGAGNIAKQFAGDLRHSEFGVLGAVASRSGERAAQLVKVYDGCRVFTDYEALCRDKEIDAIYVATPPSLHRAHAIMAMEAGKAVLCEKPFAATLEDAAAIKDTALSNGTFCMEAMWTRFLPGLQDTVARVEQGELGEPVHLHTTLGFPRVERSGDAITDPALGGGALTDLGCYCLAMAQTFFGEARVISSRITRSEGGSVRSVSVHLAHQTGTSTIVASHDAALRNTVELTGTKGRFMIEAPFISARAVRWKPAGPPLDAAASRQGGLKAALQTSPIGPVLRRGLALVRPPDGRIRRYTYPGTGLQFQADEVARCLNEGVRESRLWSLDATLSVLELIERVGDTTADE